MDTNDRQAIEGLFTKLDTVERQGAGRQKRRTEHCTLHLMSPRIQNPFDAETCGLVKRFARPARQAVTVPCSPDAGLARKPPFSGGRGTARST